jgi:hypothetical protein
MISRRRFIGNNKSKLLSTSHLRSAEIKVRLPREYNSTITVNIQLRNDKVVYDRNIESNFDVLNDDILKRKKIKSERISCRKWYYYRPDSCGAIVLSVIDEHLVKVIFFEEEFYQNEANTFQKCAFVSCRKGLSLIDGDIVTVTKCKDTSYKIKNRFQRFGWRNGCKDYSDEDLRRVIDNYVTEKQNELLKSYVGKSCTSLPTHDDKSLYFQYNTEIMKESNLLLCKEDINTLDNIEQIKRVEQGLEIIIKIISTYNVVNSFCKSFQFDGTYQKRFLSKMPFSLSKLKRVLLKDLLYCIAIDSKSMCVLPFEVMDQIASYVSYDSQIIEIKTIVAFLFEVNLADRCVDGLGDLKNRPFLYRFLHKVVTKWSTLELQRLEGQLLTFTGYDCNTLRESQVD